MAGLRDRENTETSRIMLGLLESVERDSQQTQRGMASELGIALGLVNAYLKRCITKGLVKISEAPARHYAYYLTPQGFAEKSRLTVDYLSYSFSLFRRARSDYAAALTAARAKGFTRIILAGASDLAEIARICALNIDVEIVAVVDGTCQNPSFVGVPVFPSFNRIAHAFDAVLVTDLAAAGETYREAVQHFGAERVFLPAFLGAPVSLAQLAGE
jgi:Winged helix-turn-helix DNA-binding